jgi:hypothetical protein
MNAAGIRPVVLLPARSFISIFLLAALLPYVSPVQLGSDVQPWVGALALIALLCFLSQGYLEFSAAEILLFILAVYMVLPLGIGPGAYDFRKRIGLVFVALVYYIARRAPRLFSYNILVAVTLLYFAAAIVQIASRSLFTAAFGLLIRTFKTDLTYRGVTSLTTEPSFLAMTCIFLFLAASALQGARGYSKRKKLLVMALSGIMILLTRAGSGYLFAVMFLGIHSIRLMFRKKRYILLLPGIFALAAVALPSFAGRGAALLLSLLQSPRLLLLDGSFASRFSQICIGLLSLITFPFGAGPGSYVSSANAIYQTYGLEYLFTGYARQRVDYELLRGGSSAFSQYAVEIGWPFVLLLILMVKRIDVRKGVNLYLVMFALLCILQGFPITFPLMWLALVLAEWRSGGSRRSTIGGRFRHADSRLRGLPPAGIPGRRPRTDLS